MSTKKVGSLFNIHKQFPLCVFFFLLLFFSIHTFIKKNPQYSQLGFLTCGHVVCESKSCIYSCLPDRSRTLCTSRCVSGDSTDAFPQPLWSTCHVASAHLSLLMFPVLLFVRLLMFSDTFSCNTGTNLSPLAAAPTVSSTKPCCTSCSLTLVLTVSELLLKYLAPTPAHKHVPPFLCPAGNILAWQYEVEP